MPNGCSAHLWRNDVSPSPGIPGEGWRGFCESLVSSQIRAAAGSVISEGHTIAINARQLDQFRRRIRGMPPDELAAIGAVVDEEVARQQRLPTMPLVALSRGDNCVEGEHPEDQDRRTE